MKLCRISQAELDPSGDAYDLIICASGYESRSRFVASRIEPQLGESRPAKFVFAFKEHEWDCARPDNDRAFKSWSYTQILCSGRSTIDAGNAFGQALKSLGRVSKAKILIDISCMTRAWYGEIVHSILRNGLLISLEVDFAYVGSEFMEAGGNYPPNRVAGPVPGFFGLTLPDKPTALVIGLGYHVDRALGLKDYLDPQRTILCYADPSFDVRYVPAVLHTNEQLLNEVSEENVFRYSVTDCAATFQMLDSICEGLSRTSRLVLCSLGPKIFGLSCFLVSSVRRDVSIWRVGADDHEVPLDHRAVGEPIILRTSWCSAGD